MINNINKRKGQIEEEAIAATRAARKKKELDISLNLEGRKTQKNVRFPE